MILECMPAKSKMLFYGCLSEKDMGGFDPLLMIGRSYIVDAFILGDWIASQGIWILSVFKKVTQLMHDSTLQSKVHKTFPLSQFHGSVQEYYKTMTAGKMLLCPNEENPTEESQPFNILDCKTE